MFVNFFHELKNANLPVSLREYLTLLEAMDKDIPNRKIEEFYYLSRSTLVKDEKNLDKFDRVFGHVFKGLESLESDEITEIPEEWLKTLNEKYLTEEEKQKIESMGGWDKLMEELKKKKPKSEIINKENLLLALFLFRTGKINLRKLEFFVREARKKIDDKLLNQMLADDNPQRKAEVLATMDEAFKMMEKGMSSDAILNAFKKTPRTKNAGGGLNYLMGM